MIQKMDAILHLHQEHSVDVHSSLKNIQTRLSNIEARLSLNEFCNILEFPTRIICNYHVIILFEK